MNESKLIKVFISSEKYTYYLTETMAGDVAVLTVCRAGSNPEKWEHGVRAWRVLFVQTVNRADARRCWFETLERFRNHSRWNVFSMDDPKGISWYSLKRFWRRCGCAGVIHAEDAAVEFPLDESVFDFYGKPKCAGDDAQKRKGW